MKQFILICILFITTPVFSDELQIPFSCWPVQLQEEFEKHGKKLDLDGTQRTKDSWGYLVNRGNEYTLFTYRPISKEDFPLIQKIVFKVEKEFNG